MLKLTADLMHIYTLFILLFLSPDTFFYQIWCGIRRLSGVNSMSISRKLDAEIERLKNRKNPTDLPKIEELEKEARMHNGHQTGTVKCQV
jgi:hypothetical protein